MKRAYFENLEALPEAAELDLEEVITQLGFDSQGLVPVITQDAVSKQVLMLAWMNELALTRTLVTGLVTYWSRSRNQLWVKGETSGHTQELISLSIDCDGDAILCQVNQQGGACHTGRAHCFYFQANQQTQKVQVISSQPESFKR